MLILLCFSVVLGWAGLQQIKPSETCLFRPGVACLLLGHGFCCSCCRGNNRSWCLAVWGPVMPVLWGLPSGAAQMRLHCGWSAFFIHWCFYILWDRRENAPLIPSLCYNCPRNVSWVVSVLVGQPDCSPGFWVEFNLRGNVWNTAFALKGMLCNCFRLLFERINHSQFSSFLLSLLFIK